MGRGGEYSRGDYETDQHNRFKDSLGKFGAKERAAVIQDLQDFERDWKNGVTDTDLASQWKYKQVGRVKGHAVMQIYVGPGQNYRVALMPISQGDPPILWYLDAYRRTTTSDEDVKRAKERAKYVLEHYYQ